MKRSSRLLNKIQSVIFYMFVDSERYQLSVEGACLSTLREGGDSGAADVVRVNKAGLSYLMDSHILTDQGPESILLQTNLSFRMQGISTSRILVLRSVRILCQDTREVVRILLRILLGQTQHTIQHTTCNTAQDTS